MDRQIKVLQPHGLIDTAGGAEVRQEILDALSSGAEIILVDFQDISFMDSSGLGALVAALQRVRMQDSRLCFCSLSPQVNIIMQLTRMEQIFEIFPDRQAFEQAIDTVS